MGPSASNVSRFVCLCEHGSRLCPIAIAVSRIVCLCGQFNARPKPIYFAAIKMAVVAPPEAGSANMTSIVRYAEFGTGPGNPTADTVAGIFWPGLKSYFKSFFFVFFLVVVVCIKFVQHRLKM